MGNNRINILWIEDNPLLTERKENGEHDGTEKVKKNGKDFLIPSMKSLKNDVAHFNLKILQHPEEIREYLAMCSKVVETKGANYLSNADGVIPDIVVFDYMLNENFNTTGKHCISYAAVMKPIREMFNPAYSFLEKEYADIFGNHVLFPERSSNYIEENLFQQINYDNKNKMAATIKEDIAKTKDDEFGLYAGVSVVRFFKEHITCGLPATFNKKDRGSLQPTAKYFEWLNGYDLENALQRENKGKKNWKSVLSDGVSLLRNRIANQIETGKVIPYLTDLANIASGSFKKTTSERFISLSSHYGIKILPLDGLFMDVEKEKRDTAIQKWGNEIFVKAFKGSTFKPENIIIDTARKHAETLWGAFQSNKFLDRWNFSKLHKIKESKDSSKLTNDESITYIEYCKTENNNFFEIQVKKGRTGNEYFVIKDAKELSCLIPNKKVVDYTSADKHMLSWTALFVILNVFNARMIFLKKQRIKDHSLPTNKELLTFLFPIASKPIILPIHNGETKEYYEFLKSVMFFNFEKLADADENFFDEKTKFLLRTYAYSIGLNDIQYFPEWIKSVNND